MSFGDMINRVSEQSIIDDVLTRASSGVFPIYLNQDIKLERQGVFYPTLEESDLSCCRIPVSDSLKHVKLRCEKYFQREGLSNLFEQCPIYLVREERSDDEDVTLGQRQITIPMYKSETYDWKEGIESKITIDILGCYDTKNKVIFMWVDKILYKCKNGKYEFASLFEIVLLHELTHAFLDVNSSFDDEKFAIYREESLANANALFIAEKEIENGCKQFFDFVDNQPAPYRLGRLYYSDKELLELSLKNWIEAKKDNNKYTKEHIRDWYVLVKPMLEKSGNCDLKNLKQFEEDIK